MFVIVLSLGHSIIDIPLIFLNYINNKNEIKKRNLVIFYNNNLKSDTIKELNIQYKYLLALKTQPQTSDKYKNKLNELLLLISNSEYINKNVNITEFELIKNKDLKLKSLENRFNKVWRLLYKIKKCNYYVKDNLNYISKSIDLNRNHKFLIYSCFIVTSIISIILFFMEVSLPLNLITNYEFLYLKNSYFIVVVNLGFSFCLIYYVIHSNLQIKIKDFAELLPNNLTETGSLFFFTRNISRVATPICFNVIQILNYHGTHFSKFMGNFQVVPIFGKELLYYFPLILIIIIILKVINIYDIILKKFKLQYYTNNLQLEF